MITAIYSRLASANEEFLTRQQEHLMHFADSKNYENVQCYSDNGYSGLNYDRPGFAQMMADVESGEIARVVVRDISRIGRDSFSVHAWISDMKRHGVEVVAADDIRSALEYAEFMDRLLELYEQTSASCVSQE